MHNDYNLYQLIIKKNKSELSIINKDIKILRNELFLSNTKISNKKEIDIGIENIRIKISKLISKRDLVSAEFEIYKESLINQHLKEKYDLAERLSENKIRLNSINTNFDSVKSTVSGSIYIENNIHEDSFVRKGQSIAFINSIEKPSLFEFLIESDKLPLLSIGQKVNVKFDAFNYFKHGYVESTIISISPILNNLSSENVQNKVKVVSKLDDSNFSLTAGMEGEAEVVIGKRRAIDTIIAPMLQTM